MIDVMAACEAWGEALAEDPKPSQGASPPRWWSGAVLVGIRDGFRVYEHGQLLAVVGEAQTEAYTGPYWVVVERP